MCCASALPARYLVDVYFYVLLAAVDVVCGCTDSRGWISAFKGFQGARRQPATGKKGGGREVMGEECVAKRDIGVGYGGGSSLKQACACARFGDGVTFYSSACRPPQRQAVMCAQHRMAGHVDMRNRARCKVSAPALATSLAHACVVYAVSRMHAACCSSYCCLCQLAACLHATCYLSTADAPVHTVDTYLLRWYTGLQYLCQSQSPTPHIFPYLCLQHLTQCGPQIRVFSSSRMCLATCRMLPPSEPAPCTSSAHARCVLM